MAGLADGTARNRARRIALLMATAATVALAAFGVAAVATRQQAPAAQRPSGIPASISTNLANLMSLSPVPPTPAADFSLTDQNGRSLALSDFRGKVVVLEFMDPHCTDICPLVSHEFVTAYRELGAQASQVVFAAVNVNAYHTAVQDVHEFSAAHQLTLIPGWHFFTGTVPQLRAAWRAYDITVQSRGPDSDVLHTATVYFIGPDGTERYIAAPMADYTKAGAAYLPLSQISSWGDGIALLARNLIGKT